MIELLKSFIKDKQIINDLLKPAEFSNKLLLSLINDILDFAQMQNGNIKFVMQNFNLKDLLLECFSLVKI